MTHKLSYPFTEILQVYALFFLFLPLLLVFLEKGKKRVILAVSVVFYLAYLISPRAGNFPVLTNDGNFINFSAAQLMMVIGLLIGYAPYEENKFLTRPIPKLWLIIASLGAILTIFIYYLIKNPIAAATFGLTPENLRWISTKAFSKANLGPARLAAFFCFITVLLHLTTRFWYRINQWLGWLLLPLGQFSIQAYLIHLPLMVISTLIYQGTALSRDDQWANLVTSTLTVGIAWWITRNQWLTPTPRTKSWLFFVPGIVIVLFIGIETIYRLPGFYVGLREVFSMIQDALRVQ
jgi:peptidoglycan/LPS O-acetylase OafA/YrhL